MSEPEDFDLLSDGGARKQPECDSHNSYAGDGQDVLPGTDPSHPTAASLTRRPPRERGVVERQILLQLRARQFNVETFHRIHRFVRGRLLVDLGRLVELAFPSQQDQSIRVLDARDR